MFLSRELLALMLLRREGAEGGKTMIGQNVQTQPGQLRYLPAGSGTIRFHQRAAVTTTAAKIETFVASQTVPPTITLPGGEVRKPQALQLQVEAGQTPGTVYVTFDSGTSPEVSATNGFLVPTAPAIMTIPVADAINSLGLGGGVRAVAVTSTTNVQLFWVF